MTTSHRVLIVEDDVLQSMDLESALKDAGFTVVGPAMTSSRALALIDNLLPAYAVLDYNLAKETSIDVATRLHGDGVPFVYVTGQMDELLKDELAPRAEIFQKPYIQSDLIRFIERQLDGH